jgi:hypothetical protein
MELLTQAGDTQLEEDLGQHCGSSWGFVTVGQRAQDWEGC